jgi:hypothetical protein
MKMRSCHSVRTVVGILAVVLGCVALSPISASAQSRLTSAQLATLKSTIAADPTLAALPNNADGNTAIATAFNLVAAPDFWVWRSSVTKDELVGSTSVDGTTFSWTGTGYITRTQGERDAFNAIFNSSGAVNPANPSVRQAFSDIFSGNTAPAPANRTHLSTVSRRKASRAEKLFATGTGTTAAPAVMSFEGAITFQDVELARAS